VLVAWLVFPALLAALSLGCGLLVERAYGHRLPGPLLPSLGLALIVVVAYASTSFPLGAALAPWLVLALAAAGAALGWRRLRTARLDPWATGLAIVTFAWLAAPILLSGEATFLGYFVLNDSLVQFVLVDWVLDHGRVAPGSRSFGYEAVADGYLASGYPLGAHMPLAVGHSLLSEDVAWLLQPYLAFVMTLAALGLYVLARPVGAPALRALVAFVPLTAGLVYSYYVSQLAIKELAMLWTLIVAVAVVIATMARLPALRALVPGAVVLATGFYVLGPAAAPWLALAAGALATVFVWRLRQRGWRRAAVPLAVVAGVLLVVGVTSAGFVIQYIRIGNIALTAEHLLGNLPAPLSRWQILGIWPQDFRLPLDEGARVPYALIGIAFGAFVLGALWTVRSRLWAPLLLLASAVLASIVLLPPGSAWADAKVYMIASGTVVFTAMLGAASLHRSGRRIEGWLLALALAGGVIWSNAVTLEWVQPAPRDRFEELTSVGERLSGRGPTLFPDSDEFAAYFARDAEPQVELYLAQFVEGHELAPDAPPREGHVQGIRLPTLDLDLLDTEYVQRHPEIVRRRSPVASRPPANYERTWVGDYYEVWERDESIEIEVLERHPAGDAVQPAATVGCRSLRSLAARAARRGARLAYVERPELPAVVPAEIDYDDRYWGPYFDPESLPDAIVPFIDEAELRATIAVSAGGGHVAWLRGVLGRGFSVSIDGEDVGSAESQFTPGMFARVGEVRLAPGAARVVIRRQEDALRPGQRDQALGALVLEPEGDDQRVRFISPGRVEELCGRRLDWVEVVRSAEGAS
jgi:hypothetical protein